MSEIEKRIIIDNAYSERIMSISPGPSPWYLRTFPIIKKDSEMLEWYDSGETVLLRNKIDINRVYLIIGFYCYVKICQNNTLLIWYKTRENNIVKGIRLFLLDLKRFKIIENIESSCANIKNNNISVAFSKGLIADILIPVMTTGENKFDFPNELQCNDEMLLISNFKPRANELNRNNTYEAIYSLHLKESKIVVSNQSWFNEGKFDFGYEWITRIARDPQTKYIFGDGIRLAPFILDPSGNKYLGRIKNIKWETVPESVRDSLKKKIDIPPVFVEEIGGRFIYVDVMPSTDVTLD